MSHRTLRLILGDQLNPSHSWFQRVDPDITYVMMEVRQETDYARHHIQKVLGFFGAMRAFAGNLRADGHGLRYFRIGDRDNLQSIPANLSALIDSEGATRFEYILPDEYRLDVQLREYASSLTIESAAVDSEHFLTSRHTVTEFFEGRKTFLMASFYQKIRRDLPVLMDGDDPLGGKWSYDAENRKKWKGEPQPPPPAPIDNDLSALHDEVRDAGVETIGHVDPGHFAWPVTRKQALAQLRHFLKYGLPHFGTYQDAMTVDAGVLFHSQLSFAMNVKMLHPKEVVDRAVAAYEASSGAIDIAQIEGFVRQIIGWREFVRGVYWARMPGYASGDFFEHDRKLPAWYWTGDTRMNCVAHAVRQSLATAYAHHIQRLMITGNFALLAGIDPDEVDAWYLGIYADAIEWVQLPNTRGMSQYADGGLLATKPYISSANYIDKMSDYCQSCGYDRKARTGDTACPFNSLYWHFLHRNRDRLEGNPRMGMMYRLLDRMRPEDRAATLSHAEGCLTCIESL